MLKGQPVTKEVADRARCCLLSPNLTEFGFSGEKLIICRRAAFLALAEVFEFALWKRITKPFDDGMRLREFCTTHCPNQRERPSHTGASP